MSTQLSVSQVARQLGRSEYFVRDELKRKHLRGAKIGRHWSVQPDDLKTYIESRMNLSRVRRSA